MISVIDDDVSAREGVSDLIRTLGYDVQAFESAEAFLSSGEAARSRCLIVDMKLGRMSGLDLYDHLRAAGTLIPTIMMTAFPDEQIRRRALQSGVICYLSKPFHARDFLDCIRLALR